MSGWLGGWGDVSSGGAPHKGVGKFSKGGGKPPNKGCGGKRRMFGALFVVLLLVGTQLTAIVQSLG